MLAACLAAALGLAGCDGAREAGQTPLAKARQEVRKALARGDPMAARQVLGRLRGVRPETADEAHELAALLVRVGEAPQALWLLDESIEQFPEAQVLRLALARTALLVGEAGRALSALEPIGRDAGLAAAAAVMRAEALLRLGDAASALDVLRETVRRHPEFDAAHQMLVIVLAQERRLDEAVAALDEARRVVSSDAGRRSLGVGAAVIRALRGEHDAAVADLEEILEEHPSEPAAWQMLVDVLTRAGRSADAIERLAAGIERTPEAAGLYGMLARLHREAGEIEAARGVLRRLIEHAPSAAAYAKLSQLYEGEDDQAALLELLDEALARFPGQRSFEMARIETLVNLGRLPQARTALAAFREAVGDDPRAEFLRARIELASGDAAAAEGRLAGIVARFDRLETQYWLGRALEARGDLTGAQRRYQLALVRDSSSAAAGLANLSVARKRADWRSTVSAGLRLLRISTHRAEGFAAIAHALVQLDRPEEARQYASRFVELYPERRDAWILLARALWHADRTQEAERALEEAETRFGDGPELQSERALLLGSSGRVDEAVELIASAMAAHPDRADLHRTHAALLFLRGDAEGGSAAVDRALELAPNDLAPLRLRLEFLAASGRFELARRDGERYRAAHPDDAAVHFLLGAAYEGLGRPDAAIASLRRAAALDEHSAGARNNLAVLLEAQGDLDGALEAAQKAHAIASSDPRVLDTLGWLYLQRGLVDRAISLLEEAATAAPEIPDVQLHLALAYREAERPDDARRLLRALEARDDAGALRAQVSHALRTLP